MARLFEHAQETLRLLATHALDGFAEGVRKRPTADDQIVVKAGYEAMFKLLVPIEEQGHGHVLLPRKLQGKHYRQIAELVEPAGLSVSRFWDAARKTKIGNERYAHFVHKGTVAELEAALIRIPNAGTLVFEVTL